MTAQSIFSPKIHFDNILNSLPNQIITAMLNNVLSFLNEKSPLLTQSIYLPIFQGDWYVSLTKVVLSKLG